MRGDQQAPARVDVKCSAVNTAGVDMLDRGRLTGRCVDFVDGEGVLSAHKYGFAFDLRRRRSAIYGVHETTTRMHVHRACGLPAADVVRLGQCFLAEYGRPRDLFP